MARPPPPPRRLTHTHARLYVRACEKFETKTVNYFPVFGNYRLRESRVFRPLTLFFGTRRPGRPVFLLARASSSPHWGRNVFRRNRRDVLFEKRIVSRPHLRRRRTPSPSVRRNRAHKTNRLTRTSLRNTRRKRYSRNFSVSTKREYREGCSFILNSPRQKR